ncbi:MAG: ECF-type sigma factor [Planctomycetota bacterium]
MNQTDMTRLLTRAARGHDEAVHELLPHVYGELRAVAARHLRRRVDASLEPTALVHEAYVRLFDGETSWSDRHHFFALAARVMRDLLTDRARRRAALKRGGAHDRVTLQGLPGTDGVAVDLIDLDEALGELERLDPRQHRIVELRYFGGLEMVDIASLLEISKSTVEREWRIARAWLGQRLAEDHS